jgi:hypothetical protein
MAINPPVNELMPKLELNKTSLFVIYEMEI